MSKQHLHEVLEELQEELEHMRSADVDEQSRELLRGVLRDARSLVGDGDEAPEPQTVLEQLREATREFEESHPSLAAAVGRVATALANLGI